MLATLCLNEMEWLPLLYEQHKEWPGLVNWAFVESADREYARVNPERVSSRGLSVDGTSDYLHTLTRLDRRITYLPHGICSSHDVAQGKCEARDLYLRVADEIQPDIIIVIDADEFYAYSHQYIINSICGDVQTRNYRAFLCPQRHIWHPSSLPPPISLSHEVVGGYWNVPHCRVWRWQKGLEYRDNHNWPQLPAGGRFLTRWMARIENATPNAVRARDRIREVPNCIHMGFASSHASRTAKHRYYESRGEDKSRKMYVDCRRAYETWKPGDTLPHGAKVIPYTGKIPECFNEYLGRPNELQPTPSNAASNQGVEGANV